MQIKIGLDIPIQPLGGLTQPTGKNDNTNRTIVEDLKQLEFLSTVGESNKWWD